MNVTLKLICRIKRNITNTLYPRLHTHSHSYKNAPNIIDTHTHIVAWTQSQNTKPQIWQSSENPGSQFFKNPGTNTNLERETHKSVNCSRSQTKLKALKGRTVQWSGR